MKTKFETMMHEMAVAFNLQFAGRPKMYDLSNGNIYHVDHLDFRFSSNGMPELRVDAMVAGDGKCIGLGSDHERQTDILPNGDTIHYYSYLAKTVCMVRFSNLQYDGIEAAIKWIIAWFDSHEDFYWIDK